MATEPKEFREAYTADSALWDKIREARNEDIKALGPDSTWDDTDRKEREEAGRPCLSFDELGQYVNQLVNDARSTKRAVEVNPAGDESTEDVARFFGALIRQIEDRSNAQMAYAQMLEDAAQGSFGFLRIVPRYLQTKIATPSARSFDQELIIQPIANPNTVTPGYFTRSDMSDAVRVWVHERYEKDAFERRFPDAKALDLGLLLKDAGKDWCDGKGVWVRECWEARTKLRTLVLLPPDADEIARARLEQRAPEPQAFWAEALEKDALARAKTRQGFRERQVEEPWIVQTLTNGVEVLEERTDWPGRYIPIVGCIGKVLWHEDGREILSLIRNARGPQQLYNYYRTSEAEIVGMTPKVPWIIYEGTMSPAQEAALATSNVRPVGVVKVKPNPKDWPGGQLPPFPHRPVFEPPIQALEVGAESTRRSIQSATGTGFLPTEAQRQNQKSGVALREIQTTAAKGAYHLLDNYERSIRRTGEILVDLIPHYYDTARSVHVKGKDGKTLQVRINDPSTPAPQDFGGKPLDLSQGYEFDITLSTGPSFASERERAAEAAQTLIGARPEVFQLIGPEVIRLMNLGPIGDKIAEYLETMQPPAIQALKRGNAPLPPEAQQAMAQAAQLQQVNQRLQQIIEGDQVKEQAKTQRDVLLTQLKGEIQAMIEELRGANRVAEIEAQGRVDAADREDTQAHEAAMRGADVAQASAEAEQARLQADKARMFGGGGRESL